MSRRQRAGWTLAEILQPKVPLVVRRSWGAKRPSDRRRCLSSVDRIGRLARDRYAYPGVRPLTAFARAEYSTVPSERTSSARTAWINLVRWLISNLEIILAMGLKLGGCVVQKSSKSENRIVTSTELMMTPCNPVALEQRTQRRETGCFRPPKSVRPKRRVGAALDAWAMSGKVGCEIPD